MKSVLIVGALCLCIGLKAGQTATKEPEPGASHAPEDDVKAACIPGRPDAALVTRYTAPPQWGEVIAAVFSDGLVVMSEDEAVGGPPFRAWRLNKEDVGALVAHVEEAIGKGGGSVAVHSPYSITTVRSDLGSASLSWDGQVRGGAWQHVQTAWEEVTALLERRLKGKPPEEFWQDVRMKWVPQRSGIVEIYSESGNLESRAYWYDGLRNGKAKLYDANGNFQEEGWFRDGLREGLWPDPFPGPGPTKEKIRYHLGEPVN